MSSVNDPISDMLTRIRNATMAGQRAVQMPASKLRREIAGILVKQNFVEKFVILDDGKQGLMKILLRYTDGEPAIQGMVRVSSPGSRTYSKSVRLPKVKNGLGIAIVSTSKGVLTDFECREQRVGGEVLCKVW
ncbi:MAG TPA: 30S ribosomal protein S8 [Fibrobacteres bacterium]|jgi:small subunit ribosomal protein S8|nr:30S ribosomal protein S8 [Fibrobacterota bacterium]